MITGWSFPSNKQLSCHLLAKIELRVGQDEITYCAVNPLVRRKRVIETNPAALNEAILYHVNILTHRLVSMIAVNKG